MPKRSPRKKATSSRSKKPAAAATGSQGPQRLQRVLASAGFGSRRQCEELIEAGRVMIDGEITSKLGTTVDPKLAKIHIDGVLLRPQKKVYYAVNKPTGIVTTNRDPHGRPRVIDLVPKTERIFPVGRLDRSSEGLILLTNDGDLAQMLAHPKYGVRKVYRVVVAGKVVPETMRSMRKGIHIAEGHVKVDGAKIIKAKSKATELEIVLREGKNREIRRILARLGHKVQTLRRIAIGPLRLGDVPTGAYRLVGKDEVRKLQAAAEASRIESESQTAAAKADRKKVSGASKRSAQRTAYASRSSTSPSTNRPANAGKRPVKRARKKSELQFNFDADTEKESGSVIGGDPAEKSETRKRRPAKGGARGTKKTAGKKAAPRTGKKAAPRKGAGKGTGKKRTATKGKKKTSGASSSSRRGSARTKKAPVSKGRSGKSSAGRKRKR